MRPHILFITTDEQHLRTLSCYGASTGATPNLDRLAAVSDVYERAYTPSPVCLPARCSIMTGLYPHNSGSVSNALGASLSLQLPNLFTELKKVGYGTSLHGKCHFIPVPYAATRADATLEYEHFIAYYRLLGMDTLDLQDDKNNSLWYYDDYAKDLARCGMLKRCRYEAHGNPDNPGFYDFPFDAAMHPDAWVGDRAIEHIRAASADTPQFVWVSFSGPHYPVDTPRAYTERIDPEKMEARVFSPTEWEDESKFNRRGYYGPGTTEGSAYAKDRAQKNYGEDYWTEWRRRYLGNISLIDEKIGQILAAAEKKFGENLLVIFTTDHGEMMGNHSLWGKRGCLFEDILHIPLLVRRPGQTVGARRTETVSTLDLFPTILDAAGLSTLPPCDGKPLRERALHGLDVVISECEDRVAILKDGIKLEINRTGKMPKHPEFSGRVFYELYDLSEDPNEFENRYYDPRYAAAVKELTAILGAQPYLLETVFRDAENGEDYWKNTGRGAGLAHRE